MSLSQILKQQLNDKGIGDIIKAFRLAIKTEQDELSNLNHLLIKTVPGTRAAEVVQKNIDETKDEIESLKFTFRQLTGLQFGVDLEIQ